MQTEVALHILSNSQSMHFFILDNKLSTWLNKIGRVDAPSELIQDLYQKESEKIDFKEYSQELNKEIFRGLVDNDFSILEGVYKTLNYPHFDTIIDLVEFLNKNNLKIVFERYDVSEGM